MTKAYIISEEVLRQMLDDLEMEIYNIPIKKLRTILSNPPAEPVAWTDKQGTLAFTEDACEYKPIPLFRKDA